VPAEAGGGDGPITTHSVGRSAVLHVQSRVLQVVRGRSVLAVELGGSSRADLSVGTRQLAVPGTLADPD